MRFLFIENHFAFSEPLWGACLCQTPANYYSVNFVNPFPFFLLMSSFECLVPSASGISSTWDLFKMQVFRLQPKYTLNQNPWGVGSRDLCLITTPSPPNQGILRLPCS